MIRLNSKDDTLLWLIYISYIFSYTFSTFSYSKTYIIWNYLIQHEPISIGALFHVSFNISCATWQNMIYPNSDHSSTAILKILMVLSIHFAISVTFYLTWNTGLFSLSLQTTETSPKTIVLVDKTNGLYQTRLGRNTRTRVLRISRKKICISKTLGCIYPLKYGSNCMNLDTLSNLMY